MLSTLSAAAEPEKRELKRARILSQCVEGHGVAFQDKAGTFILPGGWIGTADKERGAASPFRVPLAVPQPVLSSLGVQVHFSRGNEPRRHKVHKDEDIQNYCSSSASQRVAAILEG